MCWGVCVGVGQEEQMEAEENNSGSQWSTYSSSTYTGMGLEFFYDKYGEVYEPIPS